MGSFSQKICVAENVEFRSNEFSGLEFGIDATSQHHSYSVFWTLKINAKDKGAEIKIVDKNGKEAMSRKVPENGGLSIELPEYTVDGDVKVIYSPYTIVTGDKKQVVELKKNSTIEI